MSRDERLEWCKVRAREYLARGEIADGITSMLSDLRTVEDAYPGPALVVMGMMIALGGSMADARRFVEGFR